MRRALELVKTGTQFISSRFSLGGSLSVQETAEEDEDRSPDVASQEETNRIEYKVSSVGEGMASASSELQLSVDDLNSISYEQIKITDMNVKDLKAALVKEGFKPPNSFNKKQCVEKLGQLVIEKQLQENRTKTAVMTSSQSSSSSSSSSSASSGTMQSSAKRKNKLQEVDAGGLSATTASSTRSTRTRGSSKKGSTTESTLAAAEGEKHDTVQVLDEHATAMDIDESKPSKTKSARGRSKKAGLMVTQAVPTMTTTSAISTNSKKGVEEEKDGSSMTIPTTVAVGGRGSRSKKTIAEGLASKAVAAPSESIMESSSSVTGKRTRGKANHEEEPAALVATGGVDEASSRGSRKRMKPSPSDDAPPPPAVDSASMVVTTGVAKSTRATRSAPVVANALPIAVPDNRHQQSLGVSETSSGGRARAARSGEVTPSVILLQSYTF